jgi:hypothetical protein
LLSGHLDLLALSGLELAFVLASDHSGAECSIPGALACRQGQKKCEGPGDCENGPIH